MKKTVIIAFCLLLAACSPFGGGRLKSFVENNLKKDKGTLKLSAYKDVAWDKMYLLGPFTNDRMLDHNLMTYKQNIIKSGILTDDGLCHIMLFNGDKLVDEATFDNERVDLTQLSKIGPNSRYTYYDKAATNFVYKKRNKKTYVVQLF